MKKLLLACLAFLAVLLFSQTTVSAGDASAAYEKSCAKCHGKDGKGDTKMGQKLGTKDYTTAKVQADMKDVDAAKAIKDGLKDKEGKVLMKPTEGVTDADVKDLVAHMRAFKK